MSYPGGKSGSGIYQRIINLIPPHRVFASAFAGRCGVLRRIEPAEHSIVIDADADVCQWWDDWQRKPEGRAIAIHHCDAIEWLRFNFDLTRYRADKCVTAATTIRPTPRLPVSRPGWAEYFLFCDPPYVLSLRSHGKQYQHELSDQQHHELAGVLSRVSRSTASVLLCGYASTIYSILDPWRTIDHQVPTRGGLQKERMWLNFPACNELHDYRFVGDCRRNRERIRRRQNNWRKQLARMDQLERLAMLRFLEGAMPNMAMQAPKLLMDGGEPHGA